jgi:lipoprotein-anchoring transpeptidase ErfK/SrfK
MMSNFMSSLCAGILLVLVFSSTAYAYHFSSYRDTHGKRVFVFDPKQHAWAVYNENGRRINQGIASGGKNYCPDIRRGCKTIVGTYRVINKQGPHCRSTRFPRPHGGAPMPYCMHFHAKGYAIHGSNDVPNANASHGCIRVTPDDAKWLNHHFVNIGTTVIVLPYH